MLRQVQDRISQPRPVGERFEVEVETWAARADRPGERGFPNLPRTIQLEIGILGERRSAVVVETPFYKREG